MYTRRPRTTNSTRLAAILLPALLAPLQATQAALEATEQAYELMADQVERWPLADNASVVFRPCRSCDRMVLAVDAATRYGRSLSGRDITRDELLRMKSILTDANDTFVYIFYRPEDATATRIVLDVGE